MQYAPQNPSDSGHPDHDRYMNMRNMVERMHGDSGIVATGDMNDRAAAAMLLAYKQQAGRENPSLDPKAGVDGVVLSRGNVAGQYAILYQGDPNNPTVRTLAVPTQELIQPTDRNFQEINRINADQMTQMQAQTRQLGQQQDQLQAQQQNQARDQNTLNQGARSLF